MNDILDIIIGTNWQTIIGMFAITWYFTHDLKEEMRDQGKRIDHLYQLCLDMLKAQK
jgi:hypothetical protein